ncbi:hypothetical protein QN219_22670 [Sinorhizobium sp. 7-81]|uniref:hypothetical protein n=1 Tax=Sinorhizobium sp. 8-89 TaxID=3049089 RepID=UPI0024C39FD1|nr:hypothetical protein [Sinorhizobium sp. 8-89]MDK1492831.1 hypothetical protein [Sinorhizobium sp. 8-89]
MQKQRISAVASSSIFDPKQNREKATPVGALQLLANRAVGVHSPGKSGETAGVDLPPQIQMGANSTYWRNTKGAEETVVPGPG